MFVVELWLLRQITDVQTRHRRGFTLKFFVHTRHDFEQAGLARTIDAQHTNFGAWEKAERHVFDDLTLGWNRLAQMVHGKYVLGHFVLNIRNFWGMKSVQANDSTEYRYASPLLSQLSKYRFSFRKAKKKSAEALFFSINFKLRQLSATNIFDTQNKLLALHSF